MSSKTVPEPRSWSLALRLTRWYAASAFALVLVVTGYLYWALAHGLVREDDEWLAGKVTEVRAAVEAQPADAPGVRQQVEAGGGRPAERILLRVDDTRRPVPVAVETPGLTSAIPLDAFPDGQAEVIRDYRTADGRLYRLRTERDAGVVVRAAMDRTDDDELLARHRRRLAYVLFLALVACALGGYRLARRGLRPIESVTDTARRIGPTALAERLDTAGLPAEVRDLADTFNAMLARLEDAFARLSRFSADIAHELRTPVNNLRGEIEVALGKPRSPDEYRDALGSCLEECGRLTRLIDSLLFLARSENSDALFLPTEPVDVAAELTAVREFFEPLATEAGVALTVDAPTGLTLPADRTLFQRAVANLVSNALAHTPAGGTVTLAASSEESGVRVEVRDTGNGIDANDLPQVFDRFYRADKARTSSAGRVGLGLAIVKGIVEWHGGTASVVSILGAGTTVTLRFPGSAKMTKT